MSHEAESLNFGFEDTQPRAHDSIVSKDDEIVSSLSEINNNHEEEPLQDETATKPVEDPIVSSEVASDSREIESVAKETPVEPVSVAEVVPTTDLDTVEQTREEHQPSSEQILNALQIDETEQIPQFSAEPAITNAKDSQADVVEEPAINGDHSSNPISEQSEPEPQSVVEKQPVHEQQVFESVTETETVPEPVIDEPVSETVPDVVPETLPEGAEPILETDHEVKSDEQIAKDQDVAEQVGASSPALPDTNEKSSEGNMPWDSEPAQSLPWEEEPPKPLPWEVSEPVEQEISEPAVEDVVPSTEILAETNNTPAESAIERSLSKDPLLEQDPVEEPHILPEIVPETVPETITETVPVAEPEVEDVLTWEDEKGTETMPWDIPVESTEPVESTKESEVVEPAQELAQESANVLEHTQVETTEEQLEETSQGQTQEPVKETNLDDKFSFLESDNELLLDDVLDDDFLEDEPASVAPQEPAPVTAKKYTPQAYTASPYAPRVVPIGQPVQPIQQGQQGYVPQQPSYLTSPPQPAAHIQPPSHIKEKLEKEKKKTDAYDFPAELLAKHAPIPKVATPKQNVYTMIEMQKSHPQSFASPIPQANRLPPRMGSVSSTRSTPPPIKPAPKSQKNFFEELPIPNIATTVQHPKNPYEHKKSQSGPKNPYRLSPEVTKASPYAPIVQNASPAAAQEPALSLPPQAGLSSGPRTRKSTNPYAPAEVGGHARTLSVNSNPPVQANVVPVPHKSPIGKLVSPVIPSSNIQGHHQTAQNNHIGIQQPQLHISTNPQKPPTKYSPYTPQTKTFPSPAPVGQTRNHYQPLDSVYGDNLKPDTSSASFANNKKTAFLPPSKSAGHGSLKTTAPSIHSAPAPVVVNPENLVRRQWPLFSFSAGNKVAYLIPASDGYGHQKHDVKILDTTVAIGNHSLVQQFPGPLLKNRTKKKDVEKWISDKLVSCGAELEGPFTTDSQILWAVLKVMVANISKPGDFVQEAYLQGIVQVLNPVLSINQNRNASIDFSKLSNFTIPNQKPFNAHKLDQSGVLNLHKYLETGDKSNALQMAIVEEDWAVALILGNMISSDTFTKVVKLYTSRAFDPSDILQQNLSMCLQSSSDDGFSVEQFHGKEEWIVDNFRSIIPFILLNNQNPATVLVQVGSLLAEGGFEIYSKVCFMLSGLPLIPKNQTQSPSDIDSMIVEELYSYILQSSSNVPPAFPNGFPHIPSVEIRHASYLADLGFFVEAKRYVDHFSSSLKSRGAYIDPDVALESAKLMERLSQTEVDASGWFGSKLGRSGFDKVWGQLDKSFNKFVAGEELEDGKKARSEGVFAKYSPAPSRNQSQLDLVSMQPQSQPIMSGHQPLSRAASFGPYASSSHSHSAPTTSSNSTLVQSYQPYSQAKSKSKKSTPYAPVPAIDSGIDSSRITMSTAPLSASSSYASMPKHEAAPAPPPQVAQTAPQPFPAAGNPYQPRRPGLQARSSTIGYESAQANKLESPYDPQQNSNPAPPQKAAPSKYSPWKEHASLEPAKPVAPVAPPENEDSVDNYPESFSSIRTDINVQQPSAYRPVTTQFDSINVSPAASTTSSTNPLPDPESENDPSTAPEVSKPRAPAAAASHPPPKQKVYNPYAQVMSKKSNGVAKESRYKPSNTIMAESTQSLEDSNIQDSQIPDMDSYDFYSYGGYHAPTAAEIEAAKKLENEDKVDEPEPETQKESEPEQEQIERDSDFESEANDEPLPPPTGRILRPAASFHGATANHLRSMFEPPSAPFRGAAKSPALVVTDQKRYHAEDNDDEYYDDVVDDDDEDVDAKQAERKRQEEAKRKAEVEAKKKQEEEAKKNEQQKGPDGNGGSWFGWLGRKKDDQPKPIKAKLGEQMTLDYDEKLKRWVNRNAPPEEQVADTPPPPPVKRIVSEANVPRAPLNEPSSSPAPPGPPGAPGPASARTPGTVNGTKKSDNIEELLSMSTTRRSKRGPRRGYVDVMGQK
ncbi:hypothetical protein OGAPHI_006165 [Ogataea philodendri]|uniref:Protein transport protein sec16 n=2 Tax=Saccharomycotina TaxID=147537 RepID=A0A9P8T1I3_9ASCO|nr:uncharacterized protein OGAPHI_006165 [Ogataea philodendri]KAH3661985.1 hypothetical protein OGAPHI_006165 [Ogataea philodendri]